MIYGRAVTYLKYGKKPVIPIPNPFKDNTNAKNYRPITLSSFVRAACHVFVIFQIKRNECEKEFE